MKTNILKSFFNRWGPTLPGSGMEFMGVAPGNESHILQRANYSNMTRKLEIPAGHYVIFKIIIQTTGEFIF